MEWLSDVTVGEEEGEDCNRDGCLGTITLREHSGCSCHINPPCSGCVEDRRYCDVCDWEGEQA